MDRLYQIFPNLNEDNSKQTSPKDGNYNCLAWAAHDQDKWWSPIIPYYWPKGAPREQTLPAYCEAYEKVGFSECESPEFEEGYEKIAIYVDRAGRPTHAARQKGKDLWTSKCGSLEDIEHTLTSLEGDEYGNVACFMKREI